jgi:hypothetical protein
MKVPDDPGAWVVLVFGVLLVLLVGSICASMIISAAQGR